MSSTKTTNITLALAISTALTTGASQATPASASLHHSKTSPPPFWLASTQATQELLPPAATEEQKWEAYANSQYDYKDAALLAEFWGKPEPSDAKLKIGSLLISGNEAAIQKALQNARQQAQTNQTTEDQQWEAYRGSNYTYDDAVLLAKFWGEPEPWDAKLKMGRLLMSGDKAAVQEALQNARQQAQAIENQQWEAYRGSNYTYEDAVLLAEFWGKPEPGDAKLKIGSLLISGDETTVQKTLQEARQWAAFDAGEYTFDDVVLLAKFWGEPELWDAKLKIGRLLLEGNNATVQKALQNARQQAQANQTPEDQQWEAYRGSDYTYEDAALLAKFWGEPEPWDAKLKIGRLLLEENNATVQQALQEARQMNDK